MSGSLGRISGGFPPRPAGFGASPGMSMLGPPGPPGPPGGPPPGYGPGGGAPGGMIPPGGSGAVGANAGQGTGRGLLRVVPPSTVTASMEADAAQQEANRVESLKLSDQTESDLSGYIRNQFEMMQRHRQSSTGWNDRLIAALRMFKGEYDPQKLAEIQRFGGSDIYARLVAVKCRGCTSLLRDIYLSSERPWALEPTPSPTLPDDISASIAQLLQTEVITAMQGGEMLSEDAIIQRKTGLENAAKEASVKKAKAEAKKAFKKLDDLLVEGKFYNALAEFLVDLPLFPFACLKGPVVRIAPQLKWVDKRAKTENVARMFWERVSPFDLWWTPGVSDIAQADIIQRLRLTRADINALLGLPGYNDDAVRRVLEDYGQSGFVIVNDTTDSIRAESEMRENPYMNESGIIEAIEFHGSIQGKMLKDWGVKGVKDDLRDYCAVVWMIGNHIVKATLSPSPRKRHPFFITSFEKVPGTVSGNALPDILEDIQGVCNASLRSLVNNMSIASGPQVVVNEDRLADGADANSLYPWKRWYVTDPAGPQSGGEANAPVHFFQPSMHAQELLGIYEKFTMIADEISAIPRYITGSERMGGAGRTASGLAMLMGNASKILQTVAANIDNDVFEPCLQMLYDIMMLTAPAEGPDSLRGDESIEVRGVAVAIQKETERQRQLEFLQITNNPTDLQIIGTGGRAEVLRSVADSLGLAGKEIVPSEETLQAREKAAQAAAQLQALTGMGPPGAAPGAPGAPPGGAPGPVGPGGPGSSPPGGSQPGPASAASAAPRADVTKAAGPTGVAA